MFDKIIDAIIDWYNGVFHNAIKEEEGRPLSPQEIFDKVVVHLGKQRERAMFNGLCVYRGPHNRMCAVGCLIPDELYVPEMENRAALSLIGNFKVPDYFKDNEDLLVDLQRIHDNYGDIPVLAATRLKEVADKHHLFADKIDLAFA